MYHSFLLHMIGNTIHVLTPAQFLASKLGSSKIMLSKHMVSSLITEYYNYRQHLEKLHNNKYAQSIGLLKSVIILIEHDQIAAASLVLLNSGYSARELLSRLSEIIEFDLYNPPKNISNFIRATLTGTTNDNLLPPKENDRNSYVLIDNVAYPIVNMDHELNVYCPYCNTKHKHRLVSKRKNHHTLPDGHFSLPCLTKDTPPLKMYDGRICIPSNGYIIQNFIYMKINNRLNKH
ncbi:MAG: hypothetical protein ACOH1N_14160 [Lutibacter sp.]